MSFAVLLLIQQLGCNDQHGVYSCHTCVFHCRLFNYVIYSSKTKHLALAKFAISNPAPAGLEKNQIQCNPNYDTLLNSVKYRQFHK